MDVKEIYIIFQDGRVFGVTLIDLMENSIRRVNSANKKTTRTFPLEICTPIDTTQSIKDIKLAKKVIYKDYKIETVKKNKFINRPNSYELRKKLFEERDIEKVWTLNSKLQVEIDKLTKENQKLKKELGEKNEI